MNTSFQLNLFELRLTNFATFTNQTIYFHNKFNAIIGETGSGKSLILDAIQLILGHRADKKIIRKNCEHAIVEASFTCKSQEIMNYLDSIGFPTDGEEVVIKRVLYKSGKSKAFLNHQSCSIATLSNFSRKFVDLVGQFENQKLLSSSYQLDLLDNYCGHNELLKRYQDVHNELTKSKTSHEEYTQKQIELEQRADYIDFQISEIEKLSPSIEDEEELIKQKKDYQTKEQNQSLLDEVNFIFEGNESSSGLIYQLKRLERLLDEKLLTESELGQFHQATEILNELNYSINTSQNTELNPEEFSNIIDRLDIYQKLKRKFRVETSELLDIYHGFVKERDEFENLTNIISELELKIEMLKKEAFELADKLHSSRIKASLTLSQELTASIQDLNMRGARVIVECSKLTELTNKGVTQVSLNAQTNPGEGFYPIKEIASGGELSRILLAVRKVLSTKDSISIFLFDEIDTGIGGETALTIGNTLAKVASFSQVIAITHLPQIANFTDKLIIVSKELINDEQEERTVSNIREATAENIRKEVQLMNPLN